MVSTPARSGERTSNERSNISPIVWVDDISYSSNGSTGGGGDGIYSADMDFTEEVPDFSEYFTEDYLNTITENTGIDFNNINVSNTDDEKAFIERVFNSCMGRDPESDELEEYLDFLLESRDPYETRDEICGLDEAEDYIADRTSSTSRENDDDFDDDVDRRVNEILSRNTNQTNILAGAFSAEDLVKVQQILQIVALLNSGQLNLNPAPAIVPTPTYTPSQTYVPVQNTPSPSSYTRDLTIGSIGPDVMRLQQFLNNQGYFIAATGAGSPGNETTYFGPATQSALMKFQKAKNISPSTGYFGSLTRNLISSVVWVN